MEVLGRLVVAAGNGVTEDKTNQVNEWTPWSLRLAE